MKINFDDVKLEEDLRALKERTGSQVEVTQQIFEEKREKIRRGEELPPGVIKLVKVDVDHSRQTATTYNVRNIPTLLVFKGGQVVAQRTGGGKKRELAELFEKGL